MVTSGVKKKRGRTTKSRTWLGLFSNNLRKAMPSWQWLQKRGLVNTSVATRTLGFASQVTRLILQPNLKNRRERISFSTNLGSCRRFGNKFRWGIRRKAIINKLHTLTMLPSEKRESREGAIQRGSEWRIGDIFGPSLTADPPSWRLDFSSFKTTMSFFEASLHCYLLFSTTSAISLLSRTSSNSKVFGILATRTSNPFFATATGNVIYRTWRFFFQVCLQRCISLEVKSIPRDLNVRANCISKLVGFDDYTSRVLILLTGSPVATTPSCLDLTIRFFQLGCEVPFSQSWGYNNNNWLYVLRFVSLSESPGPCSPPMEVIFFSGMSLLEMECSGIDLLSTGSRGYLIQPGSQFPSRIQVLRFWLRSASSQFSCHRSPSYLAGFCFTPDTKFYLCF